jgi:hypothetical protein
MKKKNDDNLMPSGHLQLPLDFNKTDAGDLKRRIARIPQKRLKSREHDTLLQINRMIETISELLENIHARDDARNMALAELQKIKRAIACDKPGGMLSKQRESAEEAFENAQDFVLTLR